MKFKTLKYTVILSAIFASNLTSAQNIDQSRAIALSNAMIQMFATTHLSNSDAQVKMIALIQNVPEAEIRKTNQENIQAFTSAADSLYATLKEQFGDADFNILKPAFEHQMVTQNSFYKSCKVNGKVTEQQNDLLVPILCQLPTLDVGSLNLPERKKTESDAQFMARSINTVSTSLDNAPKRAFPTHILIHRHDGHYVPEMDNPLYFPNSISQHIPGAPEEKSETLRDEEDAGP